MALVDRYAGVIFDYGGVLAFHQTAADVKRLAELAEMPLDVFEPLYWSDRGGYDKGLVTAEDYWGDMARGAGRSFSQEQILHLIEADIVSWTNFDSGMYGFVNGLAAKGKRVAVLSNMPRELGESIKTTTDGFKPFHHVTLSYEVRSIKPEREIYEHCLSGIATAAEETLFIDDRLENIKGAKELGVNTMHFTSRDEILQRLQGNGEL
ncbi:MAG: HAD family phosphatase [Bryobacteraceae bacterium]